MRKRPIVLLLTVLLSLISVGWADQEGTVSLSLQRFLELTKQQGTDSSTPPVAAALGGSSLELTVEGEWATVRGVVHLQTFSSGWSELTILPGHVLVAAAELDGKPLSVYLKDEQYRCMIKGAGRHQLRLTYHLPVGRSGPSQQLALVAPACSASQLTLQMGRDNLHLTTSPPIPLREVRQKTGTLRKGVLPQGQVVNLSWTPLNTHPELRGKITSEKAKVYARLSSLVQVSEKAVRNQIQVDYSILRNQVTSLSLALPKEAEVLKVNCPDLESWTVESTPQRRLKVVLSRPWSGHKSLNLTLERELAEIDSQWELPLVQVLGAERVKGSVGIGASSGIEVEPVEQQEARPIDVTQLPAQLNQGAQHPLLLAYEYHQQPFSVSLKTRKGKELTVLTATIDKAEALSLLNRDGKLASVFLYQVRNNRKQSMSVTLPPNSELLNAYVNGLPVKPLREGAKLRIPLVLSSTAEASFEVRLTLLEKGSRLLPVMSQQLTAPIVDIPISELIWQLYLPQQRQVWKASGTARIQPASVGLKQSHLSVDLTLPRVGQTLGFRQLMVTEEAATIELLHASSLLEQALWWLVLSATLLLGSAQVRRRDGWKRLVACSVGLILVGQLLPWQALARYAGAALLALCLLGGTWLVVNRAIWLQGAKKETSNNPE